MFVGPLTESLLSRAQEKQIVDIKVHDLRSFTEDKHHSVDDRPFGGGCGMVMKPEPIYRALKKLRPKKTKGQQVIFLSPQGKTLDQKLVKELSSYRHLILLCGHYEGVDERVMNWVDREISIGDYVLTGGELPAMVLVDSVMRMLPGVVKEASSVERDSFYNGLLDYPNYTRPEEFKGARVPEILFSGHHARVEQWRRQQSLIATWKKRPDLLKKVRLSPEEKKFISEIKRTHKRRGE